ncbi:ceramide synthase 1-like [Glandiceps talaboti]
MATEAESTLEVYGLRTTGQDAESIPIPGYIGMVQAVIPCQLQLLNEIPDNFSYFGQFIDKVFYSRSDLAIIFGFAVFWTLLRYAITYIFLQPFFSRLGLSSKNEKKAPESSWKTVWYLCSWLYTYDVLFNRDYKIFHNPGSVFEGWQLGMDVPFDIYLLYMYQLGFYVHSIYATVCMDTIRNDFLLMIVHHLVTIALIFFSYIVRCHKMGVLVLFCHDLTDVFLEAAKVFNYIKVRNGKSCHISELIANGLFTIFAALWVYLRMYIYPLRVLYGGGCFGNSKIPLLTSMNILIWVLQFINIYWFWMISKMAFRLLLGDTDIRDVREDGEDDEDSKIEEESKNGKLPETNRGDGDMSNGVQTRSSRQRRQTQKAE